MTEAELNSYIYDAAESMSVVASVLEPIPKKDLVEDRWYNGSCRNASRAIWKGDHFMYWRIKHGDGFWEKINHYEDDGVHDVFVPVKIKGTK